MVLRRIHSSWYLVGAWLACLSGIFTIWGGIPMVAPAILFGVATLVLTQMRKREAINAPGAEISAWESRIADRAMILSAFSIIIALSGLVLSLYRYFFYVPVD